MNRIIGLCLAVTLIAAARADDFKVEEGYKSLFNDPDIVKSWGQWSDPDIIKAQTANSKTVGPVINETWYTEFTEKFSVSLQKGVSGELAPDAALKEGADFVRSKLTPS